MSEQVNFVQEGVDRFNAAFERIDGERLRLQKQIRARRKSFEKRTRRQVKRLRTELRRYPAVQRAERLQADVRRQIEDRVDRLHALLPIASRSDLERDNRKLARISRMQKEFEQPRRGNGAARSQV